MSQNIRGLGPASWYLCSSKVQQPQRTGMTTGSTTWRNQRDTLLGCAFALPTPVRDSCQLFLGAPDLHSTLPARGACYDKASDPRNWIYVFDTDTQPAPRLGCISNGLSRSDLWRYISGHEPLT